jgi:methylated-DNA-protein-cysteine methyltransferase-like protein
LGELWDLVRAIPRGKVATYGSLGAAMKNPVSGFLVGRWMAQCPPDVPWWRVVAKSGALPIAKRDPHAEFHQRDLLEREAVGFRDDAVDMDAHLWAP